MEDAIDAGDGPADGGLIVQIGLDEFDLVANRGQIRKLAGRKIVEHSHPIAAVDQRLGDVRTDEARPAGHQNVAHGGDWGLGFGKLSRTGFANTNQRPF